MRSLYQRAHSLWLEAVALLRESRAPQTTPLFKPALPPFDVRIGGTHVCNAQALVDHCKHDRGMQALIECKGDPKRWEA